MSAGNYSVYIVQCADGSLYTGIATDVERRMKEHHGGPRGAKYLKGRGPLQLMYSADAGDRSRASQLEYHIKRMSRTDKKALIDGRIELASILPAQVSESGTEAAGCA